MQLVLNKYGASIKVKNDMFVVGFEKEYHNVPVSKVKSILINKAVKLTSNVLFLAIENEIEVVLIGKTGTPKGRIWSTKYGSISSIRKNQAIFSNSNAAIAWIKGLIKQKIENQQTLIISLQKYDYSNKQHIEISYKKLQKSIDKLMNLKEENTLLITDKIRGIEGYSSKLYFEVLNNNLPDMYKFKKRSQHPAFDMFNAMLNYCYGILYVHVERALILAGIDPYLGVFHRDTYNRPVLVYDVIEVFRVWADFVVLDLCMQKIMFPDFFEVNNNVWLLNENGKRILVNSFNNYMDEIITIKGNNRSRTIHIELWAKSFAQKLKIFKV